MQMRSHLMLPSARNVANFGYRAVIVHYLIHGNERSERHEGISKGISVDTVTGNISYYPAPYFTTREQAISFAKEMIELRDREVFVFNYLHDNNPLSRNRNRYVARLDALKAYHKLVR